jgi:hypothetical protein
MSTGYVNIDFPVREGEKIIWSLSSAQKKQLIKKYGEDQFIRKIVPKIRAKVRSWYGMGYKSKKDISNYNRMVKLTDNTYYDLINGSFSRNRPSRKRKSFSKYTMSGQKRSKSKSKRSHKRSKRSKSKSKRSHKRSKRSKSKSKRSHKRSKRSKSKSRRKTPLVTKYSIKAKSRGCSKQFTKKYLYRNSPSFPANNCRGNIINGNDGKLYRSTPDKNGIYKWKRL